MRQLPGYVTKVVSGFRGTICQIEHADAVQRIINSEIDPRVEKAMASRETLVTDLERVIDRQYWKDFETLVDLIFQRSGFDVVVTLTTNGRDKSGSKPDLFSHDLLVVVVSRTYRRNSATAHNPDCPSVVST